MSLLTSLLSPSGSSSSRSSSASSLKVLCRPTGGGPRLDCRARIQFRRVHFGVRVFNVSLCASSVQLGLDLTCFVIRHPSGKKCMITKRDTPTPHQHNKFLVPGGFSWLFMVPGWFFMVPGWFFMVLGRF